MGTKNFTAAMQERTVYENLTPDFIEKKRLKKS